MLNGSGGFVVFGVRDDGVITGQQVASDTLEAVVRELRRIEPHPALSPEAIDVGEGRAVVLVRVPRGAGPYTYDGRPYVRLGAATVAMTRADYERLLLERMHPGRRWELQPAEGVGYDDLDADEIVRTAEEAIRRGRMEEPGTRRIEELLLGFGCIENGLLCNSAVVLFGRRERLFPRYPQCALRMARFRGRDISEFEDNRQEMGNAFDLFRRAQRFLRDHLPVAGRVVPSVYERVDDPLYPPVALREALTNAFCHRDYGVHGGSVSVAIFDDRMEISSTGPLRFGLTPRHLLEPHSSQQWNPCIANAFYLRGLIERWGRGTIKITESTRQAGLVAPEFAERAGEVVVRFFPSRYVPPTRITCDLTELQQEILAVLADRGAASAVELNEQLTKAQTTRSVLHHLKHLQNLGLVDKRGVTRGAAWRLKGVELEKKKRGRPRKPKPASEPEG